MKATGIVRRIDDLGRVVIPKEIRRTMRIREGDPLEIFTDKDGELIFKKYSPIGELSDFAAQICDSLRRSTDGIAAVCDRDAVIAISGGARYTVPATLDPSCIREDLTVRFRVGSVMQNRRVVVTFDGEPVVQKKRPILAPGEMEQVVLTPAMFAAHPNVQDIKISIEEA